MSNVVIIGAGDVGAATAQALASGDCVGRIVIVDANTNAAAGKALDIQQSGAIDGFHTKLGASDDLSAATGASVCIVADRAGISPEEWHGEDGRAMLARLLRYSGRTPIVLAGTSAVDLILRGSGELKTSRELLIGSAPEALASAVRSLVALDAGCSPLEVSIAVLGVPPHGFVVPWSEAAVGGRALERVLPQAQLARLEARCRGLWPPGPQALGMAAARTAEAILRSSRRSFHVFTALDGEFGVRRQVGILPVFLSSHGIVHRHVPELNLRERVQLQSVLSG